MKSGGRSSDQSEDRRCFACWCFFWPPAYRYRRPPAPRRGRLAREAGRLLEGAGTVIKSVARGMEGIARGDGAVLLSAVTRNLFGGLSNHRWPIHGCITSSYLERTMEKKHGKHERARMKRSIMVRFHLAFLSLSYFWLQGLSKEKLSPGLNPEPSARSPALFASPLHG